MVGNDQRAYQPTMSTRADITNAQIKTMAQANLDEMATQIEIWGTRLAALAAHAALPKAGSTVNEQNDIDDLKTKYTAARARLDEFRNAGGAQWQMFRPDIERAWSEFESAFLRVTGSSSIDSAGDHHEDPSTP